MRRGLPAASDALRQRRASDGPIFATRAENEDVAVQPAHARDIFLAGPRQFPFEIRHCPDFAGSHSSQSYSGARSFGQRIAKFGTADVLHTALIRRKRTLRLRRC